MAKSTPTSAIWPRYFWVLAYYVAVCLMHLQFSLWLVRARDFGWGRMAFADWVPALTVVTGCVLVIWIARQVLTNTRPWSTCGYWLLWLACVFLIDRFLTFSTNEYAHYPQYALLYWLLARALDPHKTRWLTGQVLFWATLMGMGDELLQYVWITTSYSDYLDFNDFLTNLVAAAAGMLLYYGGAAPPTTAPATRKTLVPNLVAVVMALSVTLGLLTGRIVGTPTEKIPPGGMAQTADGTRHFYLQRSPNFYGSHQNGPRHGQYYVLPPVPALLIMVFLGGIFATYGTRRRPLVFTTSV